MKRWVIRKNGIAEGQGGSWPKAISILCRQLKCRKFCIDIISDEYVTFTVMDINAPCGTYSIQEETI